LKVTKEKAAENRGALVQAAGRLFRERGIDGVGVADVMKAAGFTQGASTTTSSRRRPLVAEVIATEMSNGTAGVVRTLHGAAPKAGVSIFASL
jgi:TetR/AcrR family transcriptional regulator, transcriptional repressor for nem operon